MKGFKLFNKQFNNWYFCYKDLEEYLIEIQNFKKYKSGSSKSFLTKKYGVKNAIFRLISESGLERTLQEVKKQKHIIELTKQTLLKKYGVDNCMKSDIVKQKIKSTNLERYGVENVRQFKPFIDKMQKTKMNNPKGYQQSSIMADNLFLNIYENVLTQEDRNFVYFGALNKEFGKYGNEKYNFYDFVLLNKKKVIEFYGDYWHSNPVLEKYQNEFVHPHLGLTSKEIWDRDSNKNELIQNLGFEILIIWESEIVDNYEIVLDRIIEFLN